MTTTKISWATDTWNPLLGCSRLSPGCDSCYAISSARVRSGNPHPAVATAYAGLVDRIGGRLDWTGRINLLPERLLQPLRWRKAKRIFVNSMSDLFHSGVPNDYIATVFAVMLLAPRHRFLILTKRQGRMRSLLRNPMFTGLVHNALRRVLEMAVQADVRIPAATIEAARTHIRSSQEAGQFRPVPGAWLGVSAENQYWANVRIPKLIDTPAAVRWVSCEPLLGPIDLACTDKDALVDGGIDWVVAGGESGHRARPMHPQWARKIRDTCVEHGIPFHLKQWGEWGPAPWVVRVCDPAEGWRGTNAELVEAKTRAEAAGATHSYAVWAHDFDWGLYKPSHKPWSLERQGLNEDQQAPMRRWGVKAAGRELDGKVWDEYPEEVKASVSA